MGRDDSNAHKELLKKLLLQGLIKLMEANIMISCRECDVDLIEEIKGDAISEYKTRMVEEVTALRGKDADDIPCNVVINTDKYLPSAEDDEKNGYIGGFKMYAKKGKITLNQTLDDRVKLCQEVAIPTIRKM